MKYRNNMPIYLQIVEKIKQDILTGTLAQGEKLPSIQDMAAAMDVNQNTVFRVYKECENCGIIETRRGIGSFVVSDPAVIEKLRNEHIAAAAGNFIGSLKELGFSDADILQTLRHHLQEEQR